MMSELPITLLEEVLRDEIKVIKEGVVSFRIPAKSKGIKVGCACWRKRKIKKFPGHWKQVKISLSNDATFRVFHDTTGDRLVATIYLKDIINYLAFGTYTVGMPQRPKDDLGNLEAMLAVPEEPRTNGVVYWLLFKDAQELHDWLVEIASVALSPKDESESESIAAPEVDFTKSPRGIAYLRPFYKKREDIPEGSESESTERSFNRDPALPFKAVAKAPQAGYGYGNPNQPYPEDDNYRRILMGNFDLERELMLTGKTKAFKKVTKPTDSKPSGSFHSL